MSDRNDDRFRDIAEAVITSLRGEPNKHLSRPGNLRWGSGGSLSLDTKTGRIYDHEQGEGGGLLWFVEHEVGVPVAGGEAAKWLEDGGWIEPSRPDSGHQRPQDGRDSGPVGYHPDDPGPRPDPAPARRDGPRTDEAGNWVPGNLPDGTFLAKTYDYLDEQGKLAYQVCRYEWPDEASGKGHGKHFLQRIPDAKKRHGWRYKTKGMRWLPYRLPELQADIDAREVIFIVEGEKKVDMLREIGVPATCNHGGAGKFPEELCHHFTGATVCILPDNDEPGQDHATLVGRRLRSHADEVLILDLPDLPPKGGVDDWLPAGGSAEKLYQHLANDARPFVPPPPASKFGGVPWQKLDEPGPSLEYVIKHVLPAREVSLLVGESQSGKSFLAIDIAMSVARGVPFFGHKTRQGGVIYQAGESAVGVRRRRLPAYRQHHEVSLSERVPFVLLENRIDLYTSNDDTDALIAECLEWRDTFDVPLDLIVVDTFNKATPGANENDGKDVAAVLDRCDRIRRETGAHVMLVHHMNASGGRVRGHSSLTADVDTAIWVRKIEDEFDGGRQVREWLIQKQKDGEAGKEYRFVLPSIQIGRDADGDAITSCIVAEPSYGAETRQREERPADASDTGARVGGWNEMVLRAIYNALASDGQQAPPHLDLPASARVVSRRAVAEEIKRLTSPDDLDSIEIKEGESPDQARRRYQDERNKKAVAARDHLAGRGIIKYDKDWLWLTGMRVRGFGPPPGQMRRDDGAGAHDDAPPPDLPFDMGDFA